MKSCYWCELADEVCEHPDDEVGGFDGDTGLWICDGCCESAWEMNGLTQLAPDAGESAASSEVVNASAEYTSQAEPTPTQRG